MRGSTLTVQLWDSSAPPNSSPLVEINDRHDDAIHHQHACTVDKPSAVNILIKPARGEAYAQYRDSDLARRQPDQPPADYFPSYYHDAVYWMPAHNIPQLGRDNEWYFAFYHPWYHTIEWRRIDECDRGPDGTTRSFFAVPPFFNKPPPEPWHLQVTVTAHSTGQPDQRLAKEILLLHSNQGIWINGLPVDGTPLVTLRLTFVRVDVDGNGAATPVNPNEQPFAFFDFDMRGTPQDVEEAMQAMEAMDMDDNDNNEDKNEDEEGAEAGGDGESAAVDGGEEDEDDESLAESTPSVAETWHER